MNLYLHLNGYDLQFVWDDFTVMVTNFTHGTVVPPDTIESIDFAIPSAAMTPSEMVSGRDVFSTKHLYDS